mgnify:CR=1 FL=1
MEPAQTTELVSPSNKTMLGIASAATSRAIQYRDMVMDQYRQRNWVSDAIIPEGMIFDQFDTVSRLLTVSSGDEIVAGMRIVHDSALGFPHEPLLGLDQFRPDGYYEDSTRRKLANASRSRMGEITKLAGKKRQRLLTIDLAKCIYWYAKEFDIDLYLMVVDLEFFVLCDKLSIPITPIGTPVYCEGSWTVPAVIDPDAFEPVMTMKCPGSWQYISAKENLDGSWMRP